ncbi:hypothetical protein C8R43DRAFT_1024469 [Mycena crocata]|nr:hypothetical protein C8R43DRAFT_1024469 [Mycena crocata]
MDDQWCLDECPTCATVVNGTSIYCSPQCEPNVEPDAESEPHVERNYTPWSQQNTSRVSAWAVDCYKATLVPASSPCIFPSPSRRKLHLRKKHPTSWVTSDMPSSYISSPVSTSDAVESLIPSTSSTAPTSPISHCTARSWASPSPLPPTRPLLTKTNVHLLSNSKAGRHTTTESNETSDRPVTPSGFWILTTVAEAECSRSNCPMLKKSRENSSAYRFRGP